MENAKSQIRRELKTLLFLLAHESDQPGKELQELLYEVIDELHAQVSQVMKEKSKLKLVASND